MKVNKAPEKIYIQPDAQDCWFMVNNLNNTLVEYTRTDDFIEKALKWYCLDCICNDTCSNTCYFKSTFKKYLEGDDKQLPPKIENAINPDGSTTENYRYRHFISRMQDTFIEKAVERLKHYLDNGMWIANDVGVREKEAIIEDFKMYLEEQGL